MREPTPETVGKFQQLITKNPTAFAAAVFFIMFAFTYTINIRKNNSAEQYWKELYLKERDKNDDLQTELLVRAGVIDRKQNVIEKQNTVIKKADSTLKDNVAETIEKLTK